MRFGLGRGLSIDILQLQNKKLAIISFWDLKNIIKYVIIVIYILLEVKL